MIKINRITKLNDKRHIAILDTTAISFMQGLNAKGLQPEVILKDYDLVLIPKWVLIEINDAPKRGNYVQKLLEQGYPIFRIEEETYTDLANKEEGNLYQIVLASTSRLAIIRSYLRRNIEKVEPLDMDASIKTGLKSCMMSGRYQEKHYQTAGQERKMPEKFQLQF